MLAIVRNLKPFKLKPPKSVTIDNMAFKLHYRLTTCIFVIATALITSQELVGEHIRCIADKGVNVHVINTFCYFTSTFTVVKHLEAALVDAHEVAHPGIGPIGINENLPIRRHAYYQWVPFVLIFQAILFYMPYFIWKMQEGGRLKKLVDGLENAPFITERILNIGDKETPTKELIDKKFTEIKYAFINHLFINRSWANWLIICEILNLINLVFQVIMTDIFLAGQFFELGPKMLSVRVNSTVDELDIVFPKITKCTFHKYGPSGTIQSHDAMCIMALNIINEKIYAFLWFWFIFLFFTTILSLLWRFLTIILHARSQRFNYFVFSTIGNSTINPWKILTVTKHCSYPDWLFIWYLSKNMDGLVFSNFFSHLAEELLADSNLDLNSDDGEECKECDVYEDKYYKANKYA